MSRFIVGRWCTRLFADKISLPTGTLVVNILGSLMLGFFMAWFASRGALDSRLRMAITIGFLGGFTTYSTFAFDTVGLLEQRNLGTAAIYVSITLVAAALACFVGMSIGRRM